MGRAAMAMHSAFVPLCLLAVILGAVATPMPNEDYTAAFETYTRQFNKTYATRELPSRFSAFVSNMKQIAIDNEIEGSEIYGWTKFSDLSPEEFRMHYLGYKRNAGNQRERVPVVDIDAAEVNNTSIDWRVKNKVTPVKDQGNCGSCWAFSATEAIESAWLMAGKSQEILSPQQITSCDKKDLGCNGGDTPTAYAYVEKAGGMVTNTAYPYRSGKSGKTGKCNKQHLKNKVVQITGFKYATKPKPNMEDADAAQKWKPDEAKMAAAMTTMGPLSICVDAGKWQNYKRGIITKTCKQQLDHCVQAVGFNTAGPKPYWIVRNSWNTDWGIKGYINVGMGHNYCGISDEATIVTV